MTRKMALRAVATKRWRATRPIYKISWLSGHGWPHAIEPQQTPLLEMLKAEVPTPERSDTDVETRMWAFMRQGDDMSTAYGKAVK